MLMKWIFWTISSITKVTFLPTFDDWFMNCFYMQAKNLFVKEGFFTKVTLKLKLFFIHFSKLVITTLKNLRKLQRKKKILHLCSFYKNLNGVLKFVISNCFLLWMILWKSHSHWISVKCILMTWVFKYFATGKVLPQYSHGNFCDSLWTFSTCNFI